MNNRTGDFGTLYRPDKAILIYRKQTGGQEFYVECYDFNEQGNPINAHPLSVREATWFAKALHTAERKQSGFLTLKGLMPSKVLYINSENTPFVVWKTPAQKIKMLFTSGLGLHNGDYPVPSLIWKAYRNGIAVFAVQDDNEINMETPLYHAPFFNTYEKGTVCMGNVSLNITPNCPLEDFMSNWERAFFNSYFSHMMENHNPVNGNMVQLYKSLHQSKKPFPPKALRKSPFQLKHLIN
jgi:PRTRC genetic system protein B